MRAVIPTILVQLLSARREVHLGNLDPKRDLTFVSDTVEGLIRAGDTTGIEGEVIQLGTGSTVSIGDLFKIACMELGVEAEAVTDRERVRPSGSEVMVLLSDPAKANEMLGWSPTVSVNVGIQKTAEWIRSRIGEYLPGRYHV
jgi:UDP-glucose 4-epimerase